MNLYTLQSVLRMSKTNLFSTTPWQTIKINQKNRPYRQRSFDVQQHIECMCCDQWLPAVVKWTFRRASSAIDCDDELEVTLTRDVDDSCQLKYLCDVYGVNLEAARTQMHHTHTWSSISEIWLLLQPNDCQKLEFTGLNQDGKEQTYSPPDWAVWSSDFRLHEILFGTELALTCEIFHNYGKVFVLNKNKNSAAMARAKESQHSSMQAGIV
jgi:hypothetical protein